MKLYYFVVLIIIGLISLCKSAEDNEVLTKLRAKCSSDTDCDVGQVCGDGDTCSCQDGHLPWLGQCLAAREHGQSCDKQIECTLSGDSNLKCYKEGEVEMGTCLCSGAYSFDTTRGRCFPMNDPDHSHNDRPDHIKLEPRDGYRVEKDKDDVEMREPDIVVLEKNLADIYSRARNRSRSRLDDLLGSGDARVIGPISIAVAALLIVGICICFWSARTPSLREDAYVVEDQQDESTYRSAKTLEDGLSVTQGVIISPHPAYMATEANDADFPCGLSPPAAVRGGGHDNGGFQNHFDNIDALSGHLTTQTEVCETSHAEYLSRVVTEEEASRRQAIKKEEEERIKRNEEQVAEAGAAYDTNIKMIFKHSQEVSLTPSMDDADVEVAGIYKAFSSNVDPLAARIENLPTPPPNGSHSKRVIEIVDTDECTSIDTNISEEEVASFQRGIERQKELNLEDSIKEETDEEISKEHESNSRNSNYNGNGNDKASKKSLSSGSLSDVSAPETPRAAEDCVEFVDNVFKPVFSIT